MHKLWKQKPHRNWRERCGKRNNRWKFIDSDNMHAFFCFVLWMKLAWRILRMRKIEFFFSLLFRRWLVAGERDRSRVTDYLDSNWWRRFSISYHLIAYSNRHTNSPPSQINHQLYHFSSSIPNLKWNRNSKSDRWGAYVCVVRVKNMLCSYTVCFSFGLARTRWKFINFAFKARTEWNVYVYKSMPLLLLFLLCALFFSVLLFRTNERKCFFQQTCTHFDGCIRRLSDSAFSFTLYSILDSIIILIHSIRDLSATHSVHSSSSSNTQPHGCMFFLHAENWFTFLPMFCARCADFSLFCPFSNSNRNLISQCADCVCCAHTTPTTSQHQFTYIQFSKRNKIWNIYI